MSLYKVVILVLCCSCLSCGNADNNGKTRKAVALEQNTMLNTSWYKRFTGTIAGVPVVMNLYNYVLDSSDKINGGTYYYCNKSELLRLGTMEPDPANPVQWHTTEAGFQQDDANRGPDPTLTITLAGNKAIGQWYSGDKTKTYTFDLTEDYTNAGQLDMIGYEDSVRVPVNGVSIAAQSFVLLCVPAASMDNGTAGFINQAILKCLGMDTLGYKDVHTLPRESVAMSLKQLYKEIKGTDGSDDSAAEDGVFYNNMTVLPDYFDHGILCLDMSWSAFDGGAHENNGIGAYCLDIKNKKILQVSDLLKPDTTRICALLADAARNELNIAPDDTLSNTLLVDTIPPTSNFIISDRGITFVYNPYEIASYADGVIYLFVPYAKLGDLLTDEFKKRMNL